MTNIASTQFNLENSTLEIYFSGCYQLCEDCHNPELQDFGLGSSQEFWIEKILSKISEFGNLIENICLLGGEPLDNDHSDILYFIGKIPKDKKVWLFTSYNFDKVPQDFKNVCDYIKCGKYSKDLKTNENIWYGINLATSNQKIFKKGVDY